MILNNNIKETLQVDSNKNKVPKTDCKILKSYYNRDAVASVTKSFLTIEKDFNINSNQIDKTNKSTRSITSSCSAFSSSANKCLKNIKSNSNDEKTKKQLKDTSYTSNNNNQSPSCILFVNNLVDKKLTTNDTFIEERNSSILKEITVTAIDSSNDPDGFEEDSRYYISDKQIQTEQIDKKKFSSSSSTTSTTSSSSPKDNLVQIGVKLINRIIKTGSDKRRNLKKSDSSNSSSSANLSTSNSFNKQIRDQVDSKKMYSNSNSQSEFISYPSPQQFQLLNNKKFRKLLPFNSGLKNHGNTCFMNCVLQCLFHTSPLADFFITDQFQRDMQYITHHEKFNQLQHQQNINNNHPVQQQHSNLPQFILTKHFYRLLTSMWRNSYDSNYSAELKHLIGYMNPTFSGGNQNDSHELCVWLLDKLSQELTIRIETPISPQLLLNNAKSQVKIQSLSFIEELFQVQFKSTVICSKCNYQSNKYETDMMLSLPLPQHNQNNKAKQISTNKTQQPTEQLKQKQRRSLFAHLILSNKPSIKNITEQHQQQELFDQTQLELSKSKFYVHNNDSIQTTASNVDIENQVNSELNAENNHTAPFHVKIGVNIQISNCSNKSNDSVNCNSPIAATQCKDGQIESSCSSVSSTTSSISSTSSAGSTGSSSSSCCLNQPINTCNRSSAILNPNIGDLRRYISATYQLRHSDLVFIDLNRIQLVLNDSQSIKDNFLINKYNDFIRTNIIDSMCIVELNCPTVKIQPNMPLINIIGINVYYETPSPYTMNQPTDNADLRSKKCVCYGLPFVLLINRDCSYSDLCKKLLEAQFKYFKDKIMLKYKGLVEKLFTLSLNDPETQERVKLNSNDELPLYAECVEKFINNTLKISKVNSCVEFIKLNIEWRSFEDISNLFNDIDSGRPEFIHKSVRLTQNLDESDISNKNPKISATNCGLNNQSNCTDQIDSNSKLSGATLNDCFELFTQREELTDENSWMCPKCKKQTNATKKLCISSVPPILIIHMKRFFYKSKASNFKLTTPVWFPICNLDISKYISSSSKSSKRRGNENLNDESDNEENIEVVNNENRDLYDQSYVYDLFAVCNHKGQNMANGHYTAFCKNLIDTRWYCFDDASCTPLVESSGCNNQSSLYNNGSTSVCTENAYILFYKKRNCMRNEKWWIDYVDRSLLDSDEFDRFVNNLELIELEQHKYQTQQQNLQLKQKQQQAENVQILNGNNTNTNNIPVANVGTKKTSGLNKTFRKLWVKENKSNTPINTTPQDDELNALRRVLYSNDDQYNNNNFSSSVNSSEHYGSSNNTSVDSELVAINRQAELQRIQQRRFEEAISNNYYLNKQASENANENLPFEINQYSETIKPTRLINKINNYKNNSPKIVVSSSGDSINEIESSQPTPVPMPQKPFAYNNEFKKPFNGFSNEYKIQMSPMPPTPPNVPINQLPKRTYHSPINEPNLNASLESNERYYLNLNNNNNFTVQPNDENDLTTTEEINNVSSYHNNRSSSNFSTVDSLLSYPSDNEYIYNQNQAPTPQVAFTANMVQEYIINSSKAFYMSNNLNNRAGASLTPIQEHQLIIKNQPQSPPYYYNNQAQLNKQPSYKQPPQTQPRMSNTKANQQNNANRYINSNSIETPI